MTTLRVSSTAMASLVVALAVTGVVAVAGASPDPSGSPAPGVSSVPGMPPAAVASASPSPVDCGSSAAMLPPAIDGQPVIASTTSGVAAIDPDDLLDPMLAALGRSRADVCVVVFRYGDADGALTGQLLRIAGTHASDLAGRFVAIVRGAIVAQGGTASPSVVDLDGQTIWSLDVAAGGRDTRILAWQTGDTLLLTSGMAAMERLVPATHSPGTPTPSIAIESPPG